MKVVYLPMDSRPCNYEFPVELAEWAGADCVVPPISKMDHFAKKAEFENQWSFLKCETQDADALCISAEGLCFGSLLASREYDIDTAEALRRVESIVEIHKLHPNLPIYVCSVLMRASISTFNDEDLKSYYAMTEYSYQSDKAIAEGDEEAADRARKAKAEIPEAVLSKYTAVRQRNHLVNRRWIELAGQGIVHSLAVLQEDCQTYGFHKLEQRKLIALRDRLGAKNVVFHNGADEGGAMAVMLAISELRGTQKSVAARICWLGGMREDFTARYEDRPFWQNVESALAWEGIGEDPKSKTVLAICIPPSGIQPDMDDPDSVICAESAAQVDAMLRDGLNVYLLDVTRANGGSLNLLRAIGNPGRLAGYSAWNTASNSLGTILAEIASDALAGKINKRFLWARLLDDGAYQGEVRQRLKSKLIACGENCFNLSNKTAAEKMLRALMREFINEEPIFRDAPDYAVSLPWERTFEARIKIVGDSKP